jgi:hypothetical protein
MLDRSGFSPARMEKHVDPIVSTALAEGISFLYSQAAEFLTAWRARRRDKSAPPPRSIPAPEGMTVQDPRPMTDPEEESTVDLLQELKDLAEPIKDGVISLDSAEAQEIVGDLRDLVQVLLRTPVIFAGEAPPSVEISDVHVITQRVAGKVTGLRVRLEALKGDLDVRRVRIESPIVEAGGEATGVDLQ